ncbi:MAG: BolA/IbaG family iron-sulfur metabolism protein [Bdellovibrionota bacterium]
MSPEEIREKLLISFPDAEVNARDLTGGGDHWQVDIRSGAFAGKSLVEQHQLVYAALGDWMKEKIHALALNTSEI